MCASLSLSLSLSLERERERERVFDNVCLIHIAKGTLILGTNYESLYLVHIAKGAGAQKLPELDVSGLDLPLKELFSWSR